MKCKIPILLILTLILANCVNTSGVVQSGEDTYLVSRSEKGFDVTGSAVKIDAIKEASDYCKSIDKDLEILKTTQKDMVPFRSDAQAEIEFKCV